MRKSKKYIIRRRCALLAAVLAVGTVGAAVATAATPEEPEEAEYIQIDWNYKAQAVRVEDSPVVFVAEPEQEEPLFDVPLDEDVQRHIMRKCEESGIPAAVIIAMIERESCFTADAVGDNGNAFGLLQIWTKWHSDRMERLGVTDLLDPVQNVTVAVDLLSELLEQEKGLAWALMAYNMGASKADEFYNAGKVSDYASSVIAAAESFEEGRCAE